MGRQPSVQAPMQKYIFGTKLQKMPKNKYRSFSVLLFLFGFLIFPEIFCRGLQIAEFFYNYHLDNFFYNIFNLINNKNKLLIISVKDFHNLHLQHHHCIQTQKYASCKKFFLILLIFCCYCLPIVSLAMAKSVSSVQFTDLEAR